MNSMPRALNSPSRSSRCGTQDIYNKGEASKLKLTADGQYLKVVVEDNIGVEIEPDQRSEGFQWLVSFFIVFFAEAKGKHKNTILLLDEPGRESPCP